MTRISLFVMVALMMLMVWRERALERQLAEMTRARDREVRTDENARIEERDRQIDEALWALFGAKPADAIAMVHAIARERAATPTPPSARSIELAARCVLGEDPRPEDLYARRVPSREQLFCDWQHAIARR